MLVPPDDVSHDSHVDRIVDMFLHDAMEFHDGYKTAHYIQCI